MAEEAKKQGKMLDIGVCNRYNRSVEMLREWVEEGKFGDVYHVYASFRSCRSIPGLGGPFTTKAQSGGGVLIDWGVHFLDLILYVLGGAKVKTVSCDAYTALAKDMKAYKYRNMWAEETADIENGTNDVDDFITGYVRTDKASICFNGAWAQNVDKAEMFVDFLGDKKGARLNYGAFAEIFDGETLTAETEEYEIPNMYEKEDRAFIDSCLTGEYDRNHIDRILESAKLLDALYASAEKHAELSFEGENV
jgi:predicted dehydrogenase